MLKNIQSHISTGKSDNETKVIFQFTKNNTITITKTESKFLKN
ncbi:MAG: hypothetical protein P1U46_02135 [Patescibacteria group bacterium]|nr:hypothetical protein [Patescibacteria group bacterium]